jgi:HEAT repeat protein
MKISRNLLALICAALIFCTPNLLPAESKREEAQKLMKVLTQSRDPKERRFAAERLGTMGATDAGPALAQALKDQEQRVRSAAALALWKLGSAAKDEIPALREAMKDPYGPVVVHAAGALRNLGVDPEELVEDLRPVLRDQRLSARVAAAQALLAYVDHRELLDVALEGIQAEDLDVSMRAGDVFRALEIPAQEMTKPLLKLLYAKNSSVRGTVALRLGDLKPPQKDVVPELARVLREDPEEHPRSCAARALGHMGAPAKEAVPAIVEALKEDKSLEVREDSAKALGELGAHAKAAIPYLIHAFKEDRSVKVRAASADALGEMGTAARDAIPALNAALKDPDDYVRGAAWRALLRVDPKK